jgi:hypothetical protein
VVEQHELVALDALQWLGDCEEISTRFGIVSADLTDRLAKCLDVFELRLEEREAGWQAVGDLSLLLMERRVHQTARFMQRHGLRLEAHCWSSPLLAVPAPEGWTVGHSRWASPARAFQMLKERVLDCCLVSLPDRPDPQDAELASIVLSSVPVVLAVSPGHPLAGRPQVSVVDVLDYPMVAPTALAAARWSLLRPGDRPGPGSGPDADLAIHWSTALGLAMGPPDWLRLPLDPPATTGEAVVVRRDFLAHPEISRLCDVLRSRIGRDAESHPEIQLL